MGKRTKIEDTASMALLYLKRATGNEMLSYDKAVEYDKVINDNLDKMNSNINPNLFYEEESKLYFRSIDENDKVYLIIDPTADLKAAESYHIGCLPIDIIVASQMENALDILGLQLVDGKIIRKPKNNQNEEIDNFIENFLQNPRDIFMKIANKLSIEEREYLKLLIENKSCINCSNGTCRVETTEKTANDICVAWDNKELIGRQKILNR